MLRLQLAFVLMLGSLTALMAQPADTANEAIQRLRALHELAKKGDIAGLQPILATVRESLPLDRACDQPGRRCRIREAAVDLLATWVESWTGRCSSKPLDAADDRAIMDLEGQLESLAASLKTAASGTAEERERVRRLQNALDKLRHCRSLHVSLPRIWFASVAPDIPTHVKERWMVNCGPTPYGRWTIMRTEGPSAALHEILGGVLDLKESGSGEYVLNGIGKSDRRGAYKETGIAELSELVGVPGQYILVLRGRWSDRVADGRGGWVAKNFNFGDISFQVEQRAMPCPVPLGKQ